MNDIEDMIADLNEKMKNNWRLRWHYRWVKLKLGISEWIKGTRITEIGFWVDDRWIKTSNSHQIRKLLPFFLNSPKPRTKEEMNKNA